jgi:hypothetical protein
MGNSFEGMFTTASLIILVLALGTVLLLVLLWRQQKTKSDFPVWLMAGVAGILLGVAGAYAAVKFTGWDLVMVKPNPEGTVADSSGPAPMGMGGIPGGSGSAAAPGAAAPTGGPGGGAPGGGGGPRPMGMGGMGGGMGGMGGMMGGMGGGGRPSSKRDLTTLVRKLDLLTDPIALDLSDEQEKKVIETLAEIEKAETMTEEQAAEKHEALLAVLSDNQKTSLDAVGLPFRRQGGGGPGGPGGPGGGFGGFGGGGGPGGGQSPDNNPFTQDDNLKALKELREKLDTSAGESSAPESSAPESSTPESAAPESAPESSASESTTPEPSAP